MAINTGVLTADRTVKGDETYTPLYACEPLMEFIPKGVTIWCPFDEEWSAFVQVFKRGGRLQVVASHISEGKDFFEYEPEHWDIMISNPPFSKKDEVLRRAYELGKPFALLLPANSIQGKKRFEIFNNDVQMLCFDSRIDYHTTSMTETSRGNCFASAYFCRNFLPTKLELRRLVKDNRPLIEEGDQT